MSAQYRALEGAGRGFAMPRPGLGPLRWQPRAWPGLPSQARSRLLMLLPSWFSSAFPQQPRAWPLPSPRSRWPLQPGTCSWRAAARKVQTWGSPCVSSESLHESWLLPGGARLGLSRWRRSQRGLSLVPEPLPHPPGDSQESQDQHPEVCVLGACWGVSSGEEKAERMWIKLERLQVRRLALFSRDSKQAELILHFHFIKRGRK